MTQRKLFLICLTLLLVSFCVHAGDEFLLKHEGSGKTFGPFVFADGETIIIGKNTFTIVKKDPSPVEATLATIVIPDLVVRNALLDDVVDLIRREVAQRNTTDTPVNIVLLKPKPPAKAAPVTLVLKDVPALEALRLVAEQVNYKCSSSASTLTLSPE